jgi:hypothetical protein
VSSGEEVQGESSRDLLHPPYLPLAFEPHHANAQNWIHPTPANERSSPRRKGLEQAKTSPVMNSARGETRNRAALDPSPPSGERAG